MKTKIALLTADDVRSMGLNVDTVDGVVTLHGKVTSDMEKTKAESVAKGVDGVKQVKNLLQVVPKAQEDAVEERDDVIEDAVEKAFAADTMVKETNIGVTSVNKGVVLLKGDTTSLAAQLKAVELAHEVKGVRKVASEIKVNQKS